MIAALRFRLLQRFGPAWAVLGLMLTGWPVAGRAVPTQAQEYAEMGTPLLQVFSPADYAGHEQSWMPVLDARGIVHFGGLGTVTSFDGFGFHQHPIKGTSFVRGLALGPDGKLYAGGVDELGFFEAHPLGQPTFVSLLDQLPVAHRQMGAVFSVLANRDSVVFAAGSRLMRWRAGRFEVWADPTPTVFQRIAQAGDALYTQTKGHPLYRLGPGSRTIVTSDPRIAAGDLCSVVDEPDGALLYAPSHGGLWRIGARGEVRRWLTEADAAMERYGIRQVVRLHNGTILIAVATAGLLQLDAQGKFMRWISSNEGLPDRMTRIGPEDATGGLWVGTNNGLVRIWIGGATTALRISQGMVTGSATGSLRHGGSLYVGTTAGVARLRPADAKSLTNASLEWLRGLTDLTFALASTAHGLLISDDTTLRWVADGSAKSISVLSGVTVLGLAASQVEPNVVWGVRGSGGGLVRLEWKNGAWQVTAPYGGVEGNLHAVVEDGRGDLWTATAVRGFRHIEFGAAVPGQPRKVVRVTQFGPGDPFPAPLDNLSLAVRDGEPIFYVGYDAWRFNRELGRPELLHAGRPPVSLEAPADPGVDMPALLEDGVTWSGAQTLLLRTRTDRRSVAPAPRAFLTASVGANREPWPASQTFAPGRHDLAFGYEVQPTRGPARVETMQLGYDKNWTEARDNHERIYTNLPPGSYTFAIRAADGDGEFGPEQSLSFRILQEWWQTREADAAAAVALILAVLGLLRWREVALKRRNARLETTISERTAELREARDAAESANRAKSAFLANMSHELRTPLNGILGYAQILRRDTTLTEAQRSRVGVITASGEHLLTLINDVLDLAKVEAGELLLQNGECELRPFIQGVADLVHPKTELKGLLFTVELDPALPVVVRTDKQKLRQILLNLLSNAVKFTAQGKVTLEIRAGVGAKVRFTVQDTGVGIPSDRLPLLFQRFASSGASAEQGTGLGLALSQRFAELLGSKIVAESTAGEGSRFTFELQLPAVSDPKPRDRTNPTVLGYEGPQQRVLVVDDDATNRAVLRDLLSSVDFAVAEAADGETALAAFAAAPFDLVMLDLRFEHGLDGLQIARQLRKGVSGERMRIIAVSASAFPNDRHDAILAGCDDFLPKPFTEAELWSLIGDALGLVWKRAPDFPLPTDDSSDSLPPEALIELRALAGQGDIAGLRTALTAWRDRLPAQRPLLDHLLTLVNEYHLERIEALLNSHG